MVDAKGSIFTLYFSMSIVAVISTHAQNNCYIQLDEASGFDVTPYQADLDARACELVAAFPDSTYADSFKVYSFGFYVNLAFYDTYSYPQAFSDMNEEVAGLSPYYLLIGRQSGPEGIFTKFWVDVKLPETGSFGCMDEYWRIALDFRIQNSIELSYTENGKTPNVYVEAEKVGMDSLASFVKQQASCCDPQNRSACNLCLSFLEKEAVLKSFGFSKIEGGILQDESSMPAAQDVDDFSNSLVDVDGRLQEMIQYVQSKGHSSHGFITVDDCDFSIFSTAKQLFEADQSEYKIWWHLMKNPETGEFEVSEKISNYEEFLDEYIISLLGEDYWGTVLPGLECHETLRGFNIWIPDDWSTSPTDMIEGNIAHRIIASYYKEVSHAIDSVATEYLIPQSSSNGTGNVGYADIVNLTYGDIYEIKKYGLETQAATEALRYVEKANLFCPKPIVAPSYVLGGETTFPAKYMTKVVE